MNINRVVKFWEPTVLMRKLVTSDSCCSTDSRMSYVFACVVSRVCSFDGFGCRHNTATGHERCTEIAIEGVRRRLVMMGHLVVRVLLVDVIDVCLWFLNVCNTAHLMIGR